ncbi:aminopeptidase P family protein [Parvularcula oceani]|uniref:aminopeptidase P family protein n=1 Tax=Parvularcula oceani TaxID=1247963 RepID=UPI0004E1FD0F|nr:aminopeptidase P family protein [Parvularcula oceani]
MFQTYDPPSDRSFASRHLPPLRERLEAQGLDGLVVPHDDEYQNEYLPDSTERLMWVSGFSGSAGAGVVMRDRAAVFTDGRYTIQVREQVDDAFFEYEDYTASAVAEWLEREVPQGAVIGFDPMLHPRQGVKRLERAAARKGFTLKAVETNPIDEAWDDRPPAPCAPVVPHEEALAGESAASKRERIGRSVAEAGADAVLVTAPTSLAWLFNIRGGDVHASPLPLGRAVLRKDGRASLFLAAQKVSDELRTHLGDAVELREESEVEAALAELGGEGIKVLVDPSLAPARYLTVLEEAGATLVEGDDPTALPRAIKTDAELDGSRAAHIRDGVAITRFLHWLAQNAASGKLTEIAAAQQLEAFRRETGELRDVSFDTISASGPHGAMAHYKVSTETDRPIEPGTLYLVDSGGQYRDGTTDITRTIAVGEPSEDMRRHYTLVLKGHIALSTARFPKGTSGHALDAFARRPLWEAGLDYDHGTGHGVGSYLGVHEGPQKISKHPIDQPLMPGMICSNEPGYYRAGEYGIRIENLVIVTPFAPVVGGEREMMGFETVTFAPFERELILKGLLTEDERRWVDEYHAEVAAKLSGRLPEEVEDWLKTRTAPL